METTSRHTLRNKKLKLKRFILLSLSVLIIFMAPILVSHPVLAARATVVDRSNAHLAIWKISNKEGASGTAYAVGENNFITCAHVLKTFFDQGSEDISLSQEGSQRVLRVNHDYAVLTLAYDLALITTQEKVTHYFKIAKSFSKEQGKSLRKIGYPGGSFQILDQVEDMTYENQFFSFIPMDQNVIDGASGSPIFNSKGEVVAVFAGGSRQTNMAYGIRLKYLRGFFLGSIKSTACGDFSSTGLCIDGAIEQTEQMAEDGDVIAQYHLGRRGFLNVNEDMDWLTKSAEQGFSTAEFYLGYTAYNEEDWEEAFKWFGLAAEKGHPIAKFRMARLYYNGNGVIKNKYKAFDLFHQAAKSGLVLAQYDVGLFYKNVNRVLAIKWFRKAANKGHKEARKQFESLLLR